MSLAALFSHQMLLQTTHVSSFFPSCFHLKISTLQQHGSFPCSGTSLSVIWAWGINTPAHTLHLSFSIPNRKICTIRLCWNISCLSSSSSNSARAHIMSSSRQKSISIIHALRSSSSYTWDMVSRAAVPKSSSFRIMKVPQLHSHSQQKSLPKSGMRSLRLLNQNDYPERRDFRECMQKRRMVHLMLSLTKVSRIL